MPSPRLPAALITFILGSGCAQFAGTSTQCAGRDSGNPAPSKTLLSWAAGRSEPASEKPEMNGASSEAPSAVPEKVEPIATDRPDFTEASSTVGKGRIQLESGYTYSRDRSGRVTTIGHSYPEALLRVGALADWLEFRVGQNFGDSRAGTPLGAFTQFGTSGAEDLYLGVKLGLTEQKGIFPEAALMLQTTVPTGHRNFTAGKMQPGFNLLYGWDVIPDLLSFAGSTQANRVYDVVGHGYVELAQSLTVGYSLTERLGAYTEWFAFFPSGAVAPGVGPQHYFDGGFTFKVTPNFQLDIRAGVGLNRQADDYFVGSGFAVRY